ncbi:glycosyltransferase family 4 protein [Phormidium pseudopriestleyi FRX01]|uniref:Glycosyltransferase family 4 protein n=1 Tax=Phormidium pseudopriestleyi FRX01 TaxID=1759528 RepID=A0ABS3FTN5_9CYAN|nr:glycosyltransferase family 4 protein [Phormidium pseudopriestleyi]MBO0350465.1 glycosyltransferase family 4 protein [Phormidium pseudopriestleyi FRX01]
MREGQDVFVFLEIFSREGGIQSYVRDILRVYGDWASREGRVGEVLLLRDGPDCENTFEGNPGLRFQYFKALSLMWGRVKLAVALGNQLVLHRPRRVFCGHINLVPLVQVLCQPLGIPYTVLTYGKEVWEPLPKMAQLGLQKASRLWTISRYSRDRVCEANGLQPQRFDLLPCAVDERLFTPGPKSLELIERYGLEGCKVLMTVARLWSGDIYKGVDVTIRALPEIAQAQPDVKYLVIGRGDDQPRLQGLAQELGVSDRVVFAGFVPTQELTAHYRVADAYIMPSQEGFGIVYLEAMACGKPVLSGDADGSADPLQDGKLGWQVPHRDPQAVAVACIEMLRGEDRRCDGDWLRQETIGGFGTDAFTLRVKQLIEFTE